MNKIAIVITSLFLASAACAAPAPTAPAPQVPFKAPTPNAITMEDVARVSSICNLAMNANQLTLEQKTQIGEYCVNLVNRLHTYVKK